jgi:oxygen-independent coproporphyrinogen-3 oxidase
VAKCPYCDFNSHSLKGDLPAGQYVDALLSDLSRAASELKGRRLVSVFLGGGTPSLFPPEEINRLLRGVKNLFLLGPDAEITMEANPGAIEHGAFAGYRRAGINRLSLGAQSFNDRMLKSLGRIHNAAATRAAFAEARTAGFDNINLDLMYALPTQSLLEARADIDAAIDLQPEHISYYHLTLEPNTVFYTRPPDLPDADHAWDIQEAGNSQLESAGYINYEVSAWAKDGRVCRHNLNYWSFGDYLGVGAGAHGKLSCAKGIVLREQRPAHPREYLRCISSGNDAVKRTEVSENELVFEFMLNSLRLRSGFTQDNFVARTGLAVAYLESGLREALARRLIVERDPGHFQPTEHGWKFLDDLQEIFLPRE